MPRRKPVSVQRREAGDAWNDEPVVQPAQSSVPPEAGATTATTRPSRKRRLVKMSDLQPKVRKVPERRTLVCRVVTDATGLVELATKQCSLRGTDGAASGDICRIVLDGDGAVQVFLAEEEEHPAITVPSLDSLLPGFHLAAFQELCGAVQRGHAVVSARILGRSQLLLMIWLAYAAIYTRADDAPFTFPPNMARLSTELMSWMSPDSVVLRQHAVHSVGSVQGGADEFDLQKLYDDIVHESLLSAAVHDHGGGKLEQIEGMTTTLRDYQLEGVQWLVERERSVQLLEKPHDYSEDDASDPSDGFEGADSSTFHTASGVSLAGWVKLVLPHSNDLWYNVHTCLFAQQPPAAISRVPGGVLADEMGLGKSAEILGLILRHPAPAQQSSAQQQMKLEAGAETQTAGPLGSPQSSGSTDTEDVVPKYWRIEMQKHIHVAQEVCFCENTTAKREKQGYVQCTRCASWSHAQCAGFSSLEEAESSTDYVCFICACQLLKLAPLATAATLIVCPASILRQWEHEIHKHLKKNLLSVFVYPGLKEGLKGSSEAVASLHPSRIRQHDVVLTSFEVLSEEIYRTESPYAGFGAVGAEGAAGAAAASGGVVDARAGTISGAQAPRLLRNSKRYPIAPCPLACLEWWRVCLDEAQLVESVSTTAARMVRQLPCINRWCVSGTPVGRGRLDDLYGLALFLDQPPLHDYEAWKLLVRKPAASGNTAAEERIVKYFKPLMLRRSKLSVERQLGIPPQTELMQMLRFSSVEAHFYRRQFQNTATIAREIIQSHDPTSIARLFQPLLGLRQACSHPQVVTTGGLRGAHPNQVLSMREILYKLIEQQRTSCEEAQRKLVMSMCAVAGVARIESQLVSSEEDSATQAKLDRLQAAQELYSRVHQVFQENRQPSLLLAKAVVSGSSSLRATNNGRMDKLRLSWSSGLPGNGGEAYEQAGSLAQILPAQISVSDGAAAAFLSMEEQPVDMEMLFKHRPLVRMDLSASRRLVRLEMHIDKAAHIRFESSVTTIAVLIPRKMRLQALSFGSFVDVQEIVVSDLLTPLEGDATKAVLSAVRSVQHVTQSTRRSRSWQLLIETVRPVVLTFQQSAEGGCQTSVQALADLTNRPDVQWLLPLELMFYEAEFDVDSLQEYHVLKNYAAVSEQIASLLGSQPQSEEKKEAEEEQEVEQQETEGAIEPPGTQRAQILENEYLTVAGSACKVTSEQLQGVLRDTQEAAGALEHAAAVAAAATRSQQRWWEVVLNACENDAGLTDSLLDAVHDMLQSADGAYRSSIGTFSRASGLKYVLMTRLDELEAARNGAISGVEAMPAWPSDGEVQENTNCKRCRQDWNKTGPVCKHCRLEEKLVEFKDHLFVYRRRMKQLGTVHVDDAAVATGTSMDGQLYRNVQSEAFQEDGAALRLLRLLARFTSNTLRWSHSPIYQAATAHLALLEQYQKEFVPLRDRWRAQQNLMSAIDELKQAVTPLRLVTDEWELLQLPEEQRRAVVMPDEVTQRREEHQLECQMHEDELAAAKSQLTYLKNLAYEQLEGGSNRECVICQEEIVDELCVIGCGHAFHEECISWLFQRTPAQSITCPICRRKSIKSECMLASELDRSNGSNTRHAVCGSWGTKVTCLVSDLLSMPADDKAIVFSQWNKMLDVVAEALAENGLKFERIEGRRSYGTALTRFRSLPEVRVLLLPIKTGAQGLSLTDATHVFLLEPLLNLEQEAQAVNRVHRIGQTRPTFVHRYVIRDTVEEKLHNLRVRKLEAAGGMDRVLQLAHGGHKKHVRGLKHTQDDQEELTLEDIEAMFDN